MAGAGEGELAGGCIQNAVSHADEHVLADVREKLAVDGGQHLRRARSSPDATERRTLRHIAISKPAGTPLPETSAMAMPNF